MILTLHASGCEVTLENAPTGLDEPADCPREYFFGQDRHHATSAHRVRIMEAGVERASCVLTATGGATGIHARSALIRDAECLVAVGPCLCSLRLPDLELNWSLEADDATCFGVYHSERHRCYIVHGELDISRVTYDGQRVWSAGGRDIFTGEFTLLEHYVRVIDFNGDEYLIDIQNGKSKVGS